MAYSTNPFSVATFGESYEQADIAVTLTGVAGTGAIDSGIDVSSRTNVDLTGTQGDGAIGAPTLQAEATTGALTGVQATGAANTVTATGGTGVVFTTGSVASTGAVNGSVTIVGKAVVVPDAAVGTCSNGGIDIVADADVSITIGVSSTGAIDDVTIVAKSVLTLAGVEGDIITDSLFIDGDEIVIDAEAHVALDGVGGTLSGNTVTLDCKAVVIPTGVQGTFTVGDETIDAVQFDYESIKENYSRDRTAYIGEYSTLGNTVYVRAA